MCLDKESFLKQYKEYDTLNVDQKRFLIKILVSYIKPSFLFRTKILTPIHLGREVESENSKSGAVSESDLKWLHDNCEFHDDFEGGISKHNRRIGFFTGTYWAWKNYDKLGDPEYFGSFGYRRLFNPDFLKDLIEYDMVLPKPTYGLQSNYEQFEIFHGKKALLLMEKAIQSVYPNEWSDFDSIMKGKKLYFAEMYVLKKPLFFDFCKWMMPLVQYLLDKENDISYSLDEKNNIIKMRERYLDFHLTLENFDVVFLRTIGFIVERLTGYYFVRLIQNSNIRFKEVSVKMFDPDIQAASNRELLFNSIRNKIKKDAEEEL